MTKHDSHPPQSPPPASPPPPVVERLVGRGLVLRDGTPIIEIDYDLTMAPRSDGASSDLDVAGRLIGPFYTAEDMLDGHTLVLEDGREFDFRVIQPDTNEIVAVSDLRPTRVRPSQIMPRRAD
jgi:hypothetical protein